MSFSNSWGKACPRRAPIGLIGIFSAVREREFFVEWVFPCREAAECLRPDININVVKVEEITIDREVEPVSDFVIHVDQMRVGLKVRSRSERLGTKNPFNAIDVAVPKREVRDGLALEEGRIKRLLVLTPSHVSDESSIVVDNALATRRYHGHISRVGRPELIQFVRLRIRNIRLVLDAGPLMFAAR